MSKIVEEVESTPVVETEQAAPAEQKFKTFSVSIPVEQFELLNKHRFLIYLDKAEFYRHVFQSYTDSIPAELLPKV